MSPLGSLVGATAALVLGGWIVVAELRPARPRLSSAVARLHRTDDERPDPTAKLSDRAVRRLGAIVLALPGVDDHLPTRQGLRSIGRTPVAHAGLLALAALVGAVVPALVASTAIALGAATPGLVVPLALSVGGALVGVLVVHSAATSRIAAVRVDLRHQLSGYLDMVTMLLAGNTGHEAALAQAAAAGDGLLFVELRRRLREASTTGDSHVTALAVVADDLGIVELDQVAAATALSAAEGAPVARTLAAKCATLRSTLAADEEAAARIRNDQVTPPLVGMALLFMVLIIYPALDL